VILNNTGKNILLVDLFYLPDDGTIAPKPVEG
jgi:hypothetical protein